MLIYWKKIQKTWSGVWRHFEPGKSPSSTFKKNHVSSSSDHLSISYNTKPDHSYFNVHTILKLGRTFNIENLQIIGLISKFVFFVITQCHLYNPDESLFCLCDPGPSWEGNLAWRYRLGRERGVEWIISQYIQKNTRQYILKYCPYISQNIQYIQKNTRQYILKYCPNIYSKVVSIEILPMYFPKYI